MKRTFLLLSLFAFTQCEKPETELNVLYTDYSKSDVITAEYGVMTPYSQVVSSTSAAAGIDLDLNKDGSSDVMVGISQVKEDGVYYLQDARYIYVRPVSMRHQVPNTFTASVGVEENLTLPDVGGMMAKRYGRDEVPQDVYNLVSDAYLFKKDDADNYIIAGSHYVAVKMEKDGKSYYGWIQLEVGDFSVKVVDFAFSKIAGKKLRIGATQLD